MYITFRSMIALCINKIIENNNNTCIDASKYIKILHQYIISI